MYGDEGASFAKFPAYRERFLAADLENYCRLAVHQETGNFLGIFFAPAGLRHAHESLRDFVGVDGTHTASRFRMNLLIARGVDANGKTLPLAWALVPIENGPWWRWFFKQIKKAFKWSTWIGFVFISDREKGLPGAQEEIFPEAFPSYCCQHIADNIQQKYGVKCRPLFWRCAWAKTQEDFEVALHALQVENINAWDYVRAIPHETWARYIIYII
jgi:hypothetical protein